MSDDTDWRLLDTLTTKQFIEDVKDENFADLFNAPAYELWARDLKFFDGYEHYMLCNKAVLPYFTLHYISNGSDHYFLDGSEHPLEMLIQKKCFRLNERNILDYIQFHSDVTFYPYRKVKFITDPARAPYSGASAMGHHFKTLKAHSRFEMHEDEAEACFYLKMPVLYNGETIKGSVQVMKNGQINILEPVKIPLMDGKRAHNPLDYDHPHEADLLSQNVDMLIQSEEGKRLWETIKSYGGEIKIVSGVGSNAYAPRSTMGYIVAPEHLEVASPYQVIALIGLLREKELQLMGKRRPEAFGEPHEMWEATIGLYLDIFIEICIIVDELKEAGFPDVLRKFKESGFEAFYSGYKNDASDEDLVRILAAYFGLKVIEE